MDMGLVQNGCMSKEAWKPIPGYEGLYEVSDLGRVKSLAKTLPHAKYGSRRWPEKVLKAITNNSGHLYVRLWKDKRQTKSYVHRLVLEAFVGPCPEGMEACHWDDDPTNNHIDNLRWGTRTNNMVDMVRNGKNHNARKVNCKRGHSLSGSNLVPATLRAGRRECRSCSSARRYMRENPGKNLDLQTLADQYYRRNF